MQYVLGKNAIPTGLLFICYFLFISAAKSQNAGGASPLSDS